MTATPGSDEIDVLADPTYSKAIAKIEGDTQGRLTLADLAALLAPKQVDIAPPATLPTPKAITSKQREAIENLPNVYGKVVPTERRTLQPVEIDALVDEKETLDEVKKMAEGRLADITLSVHNHLDTAYEDATPEDERTALRDEKGHYILPGRTGAQDRSKEFSRETREQAARIDLQALKDLDTGEPDALLTHAEFLAMTTQVRVVDEAKVMLAIRKNPALVRALAAASTPGKTGTSVFLRNKK